ncbi:glutamate--tRNA ligase [Sabulicella rubraurantiaca]|uniref:glutamate--tRNA ligase n=1 Tax=Sabulicella rubraurantiaca TaxID=2811429 RepID=UPI001A9670D8|nr:glutamate--tRNA ligase [Sabulicella rubraurantiaca]
MKLRFAPSPTGHLHVGNARVALANWLVARREGGEFLLRLDDTDTQRSRPEYAQAIEEDLRWLGLDWDGMFRQSDRLDRYAAAAEKLKQAGRLYPCFETEEELNYKRELQRKQGRPPLYDRAALKMTPEQFQRALDNGKSPYWRFRLSGGSVSWQDGVLGERSVKLSAISDPVLVRADGSPLYTFTSVVDDLETRITDVVRGEDHVTNTGVQLDIFAALGGDPRAIRFAHLPLLTDSDGGPLSKRIGSLSLRQMRRDGVEAAAITGYLAALGTSRDPAPGRPSELVEGFTLDSVSHSSPRFDLRQMLALNRRLIHEMPFEAAQPHLPPGADAPFWDAVRGNLDLLPEAKHWWEVVAGRIAPPEIEGEGEFLRAARDSLPPEPWDAATWNSWTEALKARTGRKGKALFLPLRLALTGEDHGPDLKALLPLMGRERVLERLPRG